MRSTPVAQAARQSHAAARPMRLGRRIRWAARVVALLAAASAATLAAAPAVADPSPSPAGSGAPASVAPATVPGSKTLTLGQLSDMDSANPYAAQLNLSFQVLDNVYDLLEGWSQQDYRPTPGLAISWTHSDDGLTWTFKIRSGLKWSDGVPLTAADVAYTFNRTITDETANAAAYNYVKNIKSAQATDPTTVVFHMSAPDAIMNQLWVQIVPEHIWSKVSTDDTGTYPNTEMIGSGAFTLDQWVKGQFIRLKANKNYWGGAPKIDYLVYREFTDEDAMIQALEKGEIDVVEAITPNSYNALAHAKGITRVAGVNPTFDYLAFNSGGATVDNKPVGDGAPAGRDPKFRQAIAYALDLKSLTNKVLQGFGTPGQSIIPPNYGTYAFNAGAASYTYDPAKAQQMLDAAGYTKDAAGFRIDPATHKELNLRILAPDDTGNYKQTVQFISAWLADIGIKTTPHLVTYDEVINEYANAEYDLTFGEWGVEPDPSFQLSVMTCDQRDTGTPDAPVGGWSDSFYCNSGYDDLYAKQATELDQTQRAATVRQMQQLLYTDAPYLVLYYPDDLEAYNSRWSGVQLQPASHGAAFFQYGQFSLLTMDLKSGAHKSGTNVAVAWGAAAVVLVVIVVGAVLLLRRRSTADERE